MGQLAASQRKVPAHFQMVHCKQSRYNHSNFPFITDPGLEEVIYLSFMFFGIEPPGFNGLMYAKQSSQLENIPAALEFP